MTASLPAYVAAAVEGRWIFVVSPPWNRPIASPGLPPFEVSRVAQSSPAMPGRCPPASIRFPPPRLAAPGGALRAAGRTGKTLCG